MAELGGTLEIGPEDASPDVSAVDQQSSVNSKGPSASLASSQLFQPYRAVGYVAGVAFASRTQASVR